MSRPTSRDTRLERDPAERAADHAAIDRLTDELLPALIAKLGATGLGELEVREGAWRVRLRRPGGPATRDRRATDRVAERGSDRAHQSSSRPGHVTPHATARSESRSVATSPAVGIFQPRKDLTAGARVRAGDRLGAVDMLGVAQEVVAPMDGMVGTSLVEAGEAVEYGQDLITIEFGVRPSTNGTGPS
ncbi:MAG: acetyl-CoA carboxylase biotin carboxyl carrier protein [Chloroflexota bacterium]